MTQGGTDRDGNLQPAPRRAEKDPMNKATATNAASAMTVLDAGQPVFASTSYREVAREVLRFPLRLGITIASRHADASPCGSHRPETGTKLAFEATRWAPPRLIEALARRFHARPAIRD